MSIPSLDFGVEVIFLGACHGAHASKTSIKRNTNNEYVQLENNVTYNVQSLVVQSLLISNGKFYNTFYFK